MKTSSVANLFQNLDGLKPIYRKFAVNAFDSWTSAKIIPKVGKFFIVRYTPNTRDVQLIGNPMVSERVSDGETQYYSTLSLKDLTESRVDLVNELRSVLSCIANFAEKGSYTFEVLYEEKKKVVTFIDVYEIADNLLDAEIYGKRLVHLNELDFSECSKCTVITPEQDNLKVFLREYYNQQRKQGADDEDDEYGEDSELSEQRGSYWTGGKRRRKTYWIRDLCETIHSRVIYTFKNEGRKEHVARYAIVGNAVRLDKRKHSVRKSDYKDLREVPKTLTDVIQAYIDKDEQARSEFKKLVPSGENDGAAAAAAQLAFINKTKSSEKFKELLQQYENGDTVHETSVLLVASSRLAGSSSCKPNLEIFGYIKLQNVVKRNIQIPSCFEEEQTRKEIPSYLTWVKPEEVCTNYKDIAYFDGVILTNCVVPERYTGSSVLLTCQSMKSFIPTCELLGDEDLKPFIQITQTPPLHKSHVSSNSRDKRKRVLEECTYTELVEQVDRRVRSVQRKRAKFETQVMLCHVNALKDFFKENEELEPVTAEIEATPFATNPSSPSSSGSETHGDDEDDFHASIAGGAAPEHCRQDDA